MTNELNSKKMHTIHHGKKFYYFFKTIVIFIGLCLISCTTKPASTIALITILTPVLILFFFFFRYAMKHVLVQSEAQDGGFTIKLLLGIAALIGLPFFLFTTLIFPLKLVFGLKFLALIKVLLITLAALRFLHFHLIPIIATLRLLTFPTSLPLLPLFPTPILPNRLPTAIPSIPLPFQQADDNNKRTTTPIPQIKLEQPSKIISNVAAAPEEYEYDYLPEDSDELIEEEFANNIEEIDDTEEYEEDSYFSKYSETSTRRNKFFKKIVNKLRK
jgi:hypothetical protein